MFASLILSIALAPFVLGQSNNTELGVEAIEAHFNQSGIVPSLLATFTPTALLNLSFAGVGAVSPGQALTKAQVATTPSLLVTPANSTVNLQGNFTVAMVDAGPVGTDESLGQTRHWLVNSVSLTGSSPMNVSTSNGTAITAYAGPAPAAGSGAHRYVILLYSQPSTFTPPANLSMPGTVVSVFNLNDYVKSSGLGPLVAATYMTVEEGSASFTPSSTALVATSTLPAARSTGSNGGSASGTGTHAPSATGKTGSSGALESAVMSFKMMFSAIALGYIVL